MYVHRRANWEFFAVLEGRCGVRFARGTPQPLHARHLWVFPPETPHGWLGETTRACRVAIFHFSTVPEPLRRAAEKQKFLEVSLSASQTRQVARLVDELQPHYARMTAKSPLHFDRALLELSLLALEPIAAEPGEAMSGFALRKVEACLTWYGEHMAQRPKLPQAAAAIHLSVRHLRRLFKEVRDESPQTAFTRLRIQRSLDLLARSDCKLEAVVEECGFASISDFCRVFRQQRGVSPDAWRRRLLRNCNTPAAARSGRE